MRIAVQYESGWNFSGWVVGVETGECDHYKVFKGWMWLSIQFENEAARSNQLCLLDPSKYGMDAECSWCVMHMNC